MLSIILPAYKEPFLNKTIQSLLDNCSGDIEIIPVIDGYTPDEPIIEHPKVRPVVLEKNVGMRGAINKGFSEAKGELIMKIDAHCIVDKDFDVILTKDLKENWLMIPRRYALDPATWSIDKRVTPRDYHYLSFPGASDPAYGRSLQVSSWVRKGLDDIKIDDTMTFQGSCFLANKKYWDTHVGLLDDREETYGTFAQDQQEIGLKYWLNDGEIKVNKNTWYAHLQKRGYQYNAKMFDRSYKKGPSHIHGNEWGTKHWMNNEEPRMKYTFEWYIEKFWPVPTWPDNWKEIWQQT